MRRVLGLMLSVAAVASTATACTGTDCTDAACAPSTGSRKKICGEWIGAGDETQPQWYVDATTGAPTVALVTAPAGTGTWVRLTGDCAHGDRVRVGDPSIAFQDDAVRASDGNDVAVLLSPRGTGTTAVAVTDPGTGTTRTLTVRVRAPKPPPPYTPVPGQPAPSR